MAPSRARIGLASLTVILAAFAAAACGSWLGNPKKPKTGTETGVVSLRVMADTNAALADAPATIPVSGEAGVVVGTLTLDEAKITLSEISLVSGASDASIGGTFPQSYAIDLLTNQIIPAPTTIAVPAATYGGIQVTLGQVPGGTAGLIVSGTVVFAAGGQKHVRIALDQADEFSIALAAKQAQGIVVTHDATTPVLISFHLAKWLAGTGDKLKAESAADVELKSSATGSDHDLWGKIRNNIEGATDISRDGP